MAPRILIACTTEWPAPARLAGAFANVGCTVESFAPRRAPIRASRFVAAHHTYRAGLPQASLAAAIGAAAPDLIVPCDDRMVRHLLQLGGAAVERSLGDLSSYPTLLSRVKQIAAAEAESIRAAATVSVASEAMLEFALAKIGLPAVMKTDGSWGGDGVVVVNTRTEAAEAFARFSAPLPPLRGLARAVKRRDFHHAIDALNPSRPRISLQAFVAGKPATSAFACWQGKLLAAVHVDVLVESKSGGPAAVVRRIASPEMERAAAKLAAHFKLTGLHGLDFIRDANGDAHLIEMNPRATQIAGVAWGEGLDCPAALVRALAPTADRTAAMAGSEVALFPQEWIRDPQSAWLMSAYHDVPWDDPAVLQACVKKSARPQGQVDPAKWLSPGEAAQADPVGDVHLLETLPS